MWLSNLERLEVSVRRQVTQQSPAACFNQRESKSPGLSAIDQLYPGSAVRMNCSRLIGSFDAMRLGLPSYPWYSVHQHDLSPKSPEPSSPPSTKRKRSKVVELKDDDVPESVAELDGLLKTDGKGMVEWIRQATVDRALLRQCRSTLGPPS